MKQRNWFDTNLCFFATVNCMEVRRVVIIIVHAYDDPKETADLWHLVT